MGNYGSARAWDQILTGRRLRVTGTGREYSASRGRPLAATGFRCCRIAKLYSELPPQSRAERLTYNDRDIDVTGNDDTDTSKVSDMQFAGGRMFRGDAEKYGPAGEADQKDACGRKTAGLLPIGERCEEQHRDESDHIWRNSEELSLFSQSCQTACLTFALLYPSPLMMVGRKPPTLPRPRFKQEYPAETTYVFQSVIVLFTPAQSIPLRSSVEFSAFSLARQSSRSSVESRRLRSGRDGMNKATARAKSTDGQPSIKNRMRHCLIGECFMC